MYKNVQRHTAKAAHGEGRTRHPRIRYVAQLLQIRFGSQPGLFPVFEANNTSRKRLIVEKTAAKSWRFLQPYFHDVALQKLINSTLGRRYRVPTSAARETEPWICS